jgi:hypothetical protein
MDVMKKTMLYVVAQLREVDVERLMYVMYLIDRELYYLCGFTLFTWRYVFSGLWSFDVYDVADELAELGYFDEVVRDGHIVYSFGCDEIEVELPKRIKDVVDKVVEKVRDVGNLEGYVLKLIDPNIVYVAVL